ncbi:MAG: hypothetical protein AB7O24_20305 [Kofleriaceae bacterium]
MRTKLTLTLALIAGASCLPGLESPVNPTDGGGLDSPSPSVDLAAAKKLFDDNVYSIVAGKCSGPACHSETAMSATLTRFVASDPNRGWELATSYTPLVGSFEPASAPILRKLATAHYGIAYSGDETTKITEWLDKELELRMDNPLPPGEESLAQASERVLGEFAGCMTVANFQTSNMAEAFGGLRSENNTLCDNCHATGGYGFIASRAEQFFYDVISRKKYFLLHYVTVDTTGGAAAAKVVVNTNAFFGVANGEDPHREHPRFPCARPDCDNEGMRALRQFYDLTMAAKAAGGCAPKMLEN